MAQTQFRSDDTTLWWLKYGDGSDGAYSSAGNATDAPVDSSCSGTVDTTSLSATNASFANGKPILIHQSRGTGAGAWELNQIASYVAGTITTVSPLKNTYTDSGASQAQIIQLKQYSSFTQNSGHTLTAKAWDGNVGGIIAFLCNGNVTITGTISGVGKGFVGGAALAGGPTTLGKCGEGSGGASANQKTKNGNGGGGGQEAGTGNAGAGGSNGTAGTVVSGSTVGDTVGNVALTTALFGGGGGGGAPGSGGGDNSGKGADGGGFVLIITKNLAITGLIDLDGASNSTGGVIGGGAGAAGGSCLIKAQTAMLGTNLVTASGSLGSDSTNGSGGQKEGGDGGVGRIHLDYLTSYTGTTTPTIDVTQDYSLRTGVSQAVII